MNSFQIGDILRVRGPLLDPTNWPRTLKVEQFSEVELLGTTPLILDCDARPGEPPIPIKAQITLPRFTVVAPHPPGHVRVNLLESDGPKDDAQVAFFWRNPLTPSSRGIWFFLVITRHKTDGYRFRCVKADSSIGHAHYFDMLGSTGTGLWVPIFLGDSSSFKTRYTTQELFDLWGPGRDLPLQRPDLAIRSCRIFTPEGDHKHLHSRADLDAALLHADDPGRAREPKFLLRFEQGAADARLVAGFTAKKFSDLDDDEGDEGWRVNSRALRLEAREPLSSSIYRWNQPLALSCVRLRMGAEDATEPAEWLADLVGVSLAVHSDAHDVRAHELLSLRAVWRDLFQHYPVGLRSLRSRNALSFVPTDVDGSGQASLRFSVLPAAESWVTRLAAAALTGAPTVHLTLASSTDVDGNIPSIDAPLRSRPVAFPPLVDSTARPLDLIRLELAGESSALGRLLIGGLLLDVGKAPAPSKERPQELRVALQRSRADLGRAALTMSMDVSFACARPRVAGDDPERGFEVDAPWLQRERPVVIDLDLKASIQSADENTLRVRERASAESSRVLELLLTGKEKSRLEYDVVVLDPSPYLAARVLAKDETVADPNGILGVYRDDPDRPPGWELRTTSGNMLLLLPPQTIGEEMIKGDLRVAADPNDPSKTIPVPFKKRPFDVRLSPPARLELDRTDIDTARAPAPWALRRLFDRREAVVGLRLRRGEFELFYGMPATIDAADDRRRRLRLAEQAAFIGRIPFPDALLRAFLDQQTGVAQNDDGVYATDVARWIRGVLHRPARLPVFEDALSRDTLTIAEGVSFGLRATRQTANPFALEALHPADLPTKPEIPLPGPDRLSQPPFTMDSRLPLRGGFDYGFESRNIYDAVRDQTRIPLTNQGQITGLVFGALGGSGRQQALFDEGRTLVITTTTDGRLDTLTIVRVGRIAMLWHHARHVIVYERTTRTAPRYQSGTGKPVADQPSDFEGLAALRKIREFIEITQPRRSYPDFTGTTAAAGPLADVFFETTVIPVKSTWGHDVPDGWVMALRGPLAPVEEQFYPFPHIFTACARAESKGGGAINQPVTNPEDLFFYTSTRKGEGGDPDRWPAVADVDFSLTQRPRPPALPALPSFSGARRQPDAQVHDYGQRRFTIRVVPAEEAIDLMHGREVAGVEARLSSLSLSRGRPALAPPPGGVEEKVGVLLASAEARIQDGLREVAQRAADLARLAVEGRIADVDRLRGEALALLRDLKQQASDLQKAVSAHAPAIEKAGEWTAIQQRWVDTAKAEAVKAVQDWTDRLRGSLEATVKRLADQGPKDEIANRARDAARMFCAEASNRIGNVAFLPERVADRFEIVLDRMRHEAFDSVERPRLQLSATIDALREQFGTVAPGELNAQLDEFLARAQSDSEALVVNAARAIKDALGEWFGDLPGEGVAVDELLAPFTDIVGGMASWLDEIREEIPPFEREPDWDALKELLSGPFENIKADIAEAFAKVDAHVSALRDAVGIPRLGEPQAGTWGAARAAVLAEAKKACDEQAEKLANAAGDLTTFTKQVNEALTALPGAATAAIQGQVLQAVAQLEALTTKGGKPFEALAKVTKAATAIQNQVLQQIEDLERLLNRGDALLSELASAAAGAAEKAAAALRAVGEQVERAVVKELRDIAGRVQEGVLEITRALAEGPITDTLRCTRDLVGYYYDLEKQVLDVTRSGAIFNDLGVGTLNGLGANVPFDRIRDRILPQVPRLDFNKLFPDFAGLKLQHLLRGLVVPEDPLREYDWLKMTHGFDKDRLTAWSDVVIDKEFEGDPELFELPPISVAVARPRFRASSRIEAGRDTGVTMQRTAGEISADWTVRLKGDPILTIERGRLHFNSTGGFGFDFEVRDLTLAPALQFITDLLSAIAPAENGLAIIPVPPAGISVTLDLPLPDVGTGAFTITGVTLHTHFDLLVFGGFEVRTGLWLSRPERPFGLAVLFLGGGGWFGVDVRYRPPNEFETRVSIGIAAGAFLSLNFGIARGSAGLMLALGLDFRRNSRTGGSGDVAVSLSLLIWGELSVLGIASIYVRVVLRIEYRNGSMTGYGSVSVSIKICWCFTLSATINMRIPLGSGGSSQRVRSFVRFASLDAPALLDDAIEKAVRAHFLNIDW